MTITSIAAINAMIKSRFDAANLPRITGPPEYDRFDELVEAIAQITTIFKTKRYDGKCGVLPLTVSKDKARRDTNNNALYCSHTVDAALRNPRITLSTLPNKNKTLNTEHKVAWSKYELEVVVDRYTVA